MDLLSPAHLVSKERRRMEEAGAEVREVRAQVDEPSIDEDDKGLIVYIVLIKVYMHFMHCI